MIKIIATNRKAFHEYQILEKVEAGLALTGTEVKSLRAGNVRMGDAYAWPVRGELYLQNLHIPEFKQGNVYNHDPMRDRKLLLHKKEIERLIGKCQEKGLNIVPLKLYFKDSWVKVELGLGKGKKLYDKRETLKRKAVERDHERKFRIKG